MVQSRKIIKSVENSYLPLTHPPPASVILSNFIFPIKNLKTNLVENVLYIVTIRQRYLI